MTTRLLTPVEQIRMRLADTQPRTLTHRREMPSLRLILTATYRTEPHAHAAALAFSGRRADWSGPTRWLAFPHPNISIEFRVDDHQPRHRLPGRPAQGPKGRHSVLSGRHVDREREVA